MRSASIGKIVGQLALLFWLVLLVCCESGRVSRNESGVANRVIDHADILTTEQEDSIYTLIEKLRMDVGSELAVLTIDSLGGEKIEDFSIRFLQEIGLGRDTERDGLLITVARRERTVRIEVGTGLENIIRDETAAQIIRDDIVPAFRAGKFGQGLYAATDKIVRRITDNKEKVGQEPRWK